MCCGKKAVQAATIDRSFDVKHDSKPYTVMVHTMPIERCVECGEYTLGSDSDECIDAALRKQLGLLMPETIRANRKQLKQTQEQLASAVGCASETLSRWENGVLVQSCGADRLLRAYFALPALRAFFAELEIDRNLGAHVLVVPALYTSIVSRVGNSIVKRPIMPTAVMVPFQVAQSNIGSLGATPTFLALTDDQPMVKYVAA